MNVDFFKKEKMAKMKEHDKDGVAALNVVVSKIMLMQKSGNGSELSEADLISILQKSEKELIEEKDGFEKAGSAYADRVQSLENQIATIKSYLPQMMSREEIKEVILSLEDKSVPSVMRHFKSNYAGKCDMKVVGEVLRSL